jgi:hypothetical protein
MKKLSLMKRLLFSGEVKGKVEIFQNHFLWKIRPDLDEPSPQIIERGLATWLRSKALMTIFYPALANRSL